MKKNKKRDEFLVQLRKIPIVQVACEKSGISRNSVYRWRNDDEEFRKEMEAALIEGEALVNDMSESQLLSMIRDRNWSAISFWLRHRNPKFRDRLEVTANIKSPHTFNPEELAMIAEGLVRSALPSPVEDALPTNQETKHEPNSTE